MNKKYLIIVIIGIIALVIIYLLILPKDKSQELSIVVSDDGKAKLEISEDVLPVGTSIEDISIIRINSEEIEGVVTAYRLEPEGLELQKPATISISMDIEEESMPEGGGNGVQLVQVYHVQEDSINIIEGQKGVVDFGTGKMVIRASISSFSSLLVPTFHPRVWFSLRGEKGITVLEGEVYEISEEEAIFFVKESFYAQATIEHKKEIRTMERKSAPPGATGYNRWTLIERGAISELEVEDWFFDPPQDVPKISPKLVLPYFFWIAPGETKQTEEEKFTCVEPGGRALDILDYGKDFGNINYMVGGANFKYSWVERIYFNSPSGKKEHIGFREGRDTSIDVEWQFLIPITCLPEPEDKDALLPPEPEEMVTPEPPPAPSAPSDSNEARCLEVCGSDRYFPVTSLEECSDTSEAFLCIQNKQACYNYLIPRGWQTDSNCCCKDEPIEMYAGDRIDCSKFMGWGINGYAVDKNPYYQFGESTNSAAECK